MRLSLVFELLLIFVLIAFAASRVIDSSGVRSIRAVAQKHKGKVSHKNRQNTANKYCNCSAKLCNCCREFNIPVVALQGPGCASLQYLRGDRLAISMSFGDRVLTNTTVDSKKPKPVCMPLPGGVSKFCGRVYNIGRQGEDFNACLGLELRAVQDIEAALRVSCFRFGPKGLKVEPPQPLPVVQSEANEEDDDDDQDEDDYDFDDVDDDDDDDEESDDDGDVDTVDYGEFSVFDDDFIDSLFVPESSGSKKKKVTTTTKAPLKKAVTRKPVKQTVTKTKATITRKKVVSTTARPATKNPITPVANPQNTKIVPQKIFAPVPTNEPSSTTTKVKITTAEPIQETSQSVEMLLNEPIENNIVQDEEPIVKVSSESVPSSSHESIAAVTAMLQHMSEEAAPPTPVETKPVILPAPVRVSSSPITEPEPPNASLSQTEGSSSSETILAAITETTQRNVLESMNSVAPSVTSTENETTQLASDASDDEDDTPVQNFIIKNDETDSEEESDPLSETIEDFIKDEIDSSESVDSKNSTKKIETKGDKKEEDENLDSTTNLIETSSKGSADDDDDDDILNYDDDNDNDDEEEEDDDDDDDNFGLRKSKQQYARKKRGRQSKDMWLH